ncbi:hypothetical protein [Photobacterium damselae]|uniref:hypothetical protein n=1 Tax=Photobacterium damselae TaxID=38293 RepID=UPI001F28E118|nr:hypothetical protein [Photobacterium damselae]UKA04776.1 hypothetical protein IHC89_21275 [Photobacterium damselae subsp. damselae]
MLKSIANQLANVHHLASMESRRLLLSSISSMAQDDATGNITLANSETGDTFDVAAISIAHPEELISAAKDQGCDLVVIDGGNSHGDAFKITLNVNNGAFFFIHQQ